MHKRLGVKLDEELCTCPYDPLHVVQRLKFSKHVLKCKKEYPHVIVGHCHFNSAHIVPLKDLDAHLKVCKDKDDVKRLIHKPHVPASQVLPEEPDYNHEPSETWDDEVSNNPVVGVPEEELKTTRYKDLAGMKPKEKKEYRARLAKLEAGIEEDKACGSGGGDTSGLAPLQPLPKPTGRPTDLVSHLFPSDSGSSGGSGSGRMVNGAAGDGTAAAAATGTGRGMVRAVAAAAAATAASNGRPGGLAAAATATASAAASQPPPRDFTGSLQYMEEYNAAAAAATDRKPGGIGRGIIRSAVPKRNE